MGDRDPRPCGPCGVFADWRRRKNGGHSLQRHRQTLDNVSADTLRSFTSKLTLLASVAVHVRL